MSALGERNYSFLNDESFMDEQQLEYFRQRLLDWRSQLLQDSGNTIKHLKESTIVEADVIDAASNETERTIELQARERQRKLMNQIEQALRRINEGTYGYCEETGDPIGLRRLDARPIATLSIEAQERQERRERLQRDDW